jgi:hypothetical protein
MVNTRKIQMVNTLEENKKFFTPRQFERAKSAQDLFHSLGCPSIMNLKGAIRMNLIRDNPVTTNDVDLAEQIFGPYVGTVKGKTTRQKPLPIVDQHIQIPEELISVHADITLAIDGLTINSLKFLSTISRNMYYCTVHYMPTTEAKNYQTTLKEVCGVYCQGGFQVTDILCDNKFHASMDPIAASQNPPITMHYTAAQEHVPEAERNNRVIKEQFRAVYHRLPYTHLPRILVKYLAYESARKPNNIYKPNIFPARRGVSKYFSPRMIIHQENIAYNTHCKTSCGTYVLAHNEPDPTNTNGPCALDCLYLRPNASGRHKCLHLQTNRVITRRRVTPLLVTPAIVKLVHTIAENYGMPQGLKISNRYGTVLFDSSWIAGVDYNNEQFEDKDYNDKEYEPYNHDNNNDDDNNDDDDKEEEYQDQMDPNEVADILQDWTQNAGVDAPPPGVDVPNKEPPDYQNKEEEIVFGEQEDEPQAEEESIATPAEEDPTSYETRSSCISRPKTRMNLYQAEQHLSHQKAHVEEYSQETAQVIATVMCHWNNVCKHYNDTKLAMFIQTYSLNKGMKQFGQKGMDAAIKEMKQLHDRTVFEGIKVSHMTPLERKRAMESPLFLIKNAMEESRQGPVLMVACNANTWIEKMQRAQRQPRSQTSLQE